MDFKNVPNKYRPIPFWSWNEKLDIEETARQIEEMHKVGIGGFFMHARGGLQTEYMCKEWFDNVTCSIEAAKKFDMGAWAYDENGWPSGFGSGKVNGKGIKYQQKYLRMEKGEKHTPETLVNCDGYHFYYEVNPFYVDTLDKEVTADFINEIYEPYYKQYKNELMGFFTDEPQISRNGIPWSFKLPEAYKKAYGEEIFPHIKELFISEGDYKNTRIKFWKLITDMFSANFMKPIYDWCQSHGLSLTGHLVLEEEFSLQLTSNGAVMPHYEYFTIPGMDWLGRPIYDCLIHTQVASVAQQLGKKQVLSETFALCGHNVSFEELRRIYEWQMVHGINLLCQHLEGYTLRGIRKRDYPPAMNYQQPWWDEYKVFNDAMSRIGMILTEGEVHFDTLLMHPMTTAWTMYDDNDDSAILEYDKQYDQIIRSLEEKHLLFHLGDETILQRHGRVLGNKLIVGTQEYTTVIMVPDMLLLDDTRKLLDEFKANGGKIVFPDEMPENDIVDNKNITYTKRDYADFSVHYFVNSTEDKQIANIKKGSKVVDIKTGELCDFDGYYEFAPFDSLLVIDDGSKQAEREQKKELKTLSLDGEWNIVDASENVLTLDYCDYYFDGELQEKNGYVLNIQNRACELKRPVKIKQDYFVEVSEVPDSLFLVTETPENFKIFINGVEINRQEQGFFVDKSFRKIPVGDYFTQGKNTITFECVFSQSETVYENIVKGKIFESERNKLTYDMEIEAVYLVGDFSVQISQKVAKLDKDAIRIPNDFTISNAKKAITLRNIEQQGYPFFAGSMTVEKEFDISDKNQKLVFSKKGINVIKAEINGSAAGTVIWNPTELDVSEYLKCGKNTIRLTIINNLRNMLGPHHHDDGELHGVHPGVFFKERCVWQNSDISWWNDDYCLVEVGLI